MEETNEFEPAEAPTDNIPAQEADISAGSGPNENIARTEPSSVKKEAEVLELGDVSASDAAEKLPAAVSQSEASSSDTATLDIKNDVVEVADLEGKGELDIVDAVERGPKTHLAVERTDYPEGGLLAWLVVGGAFLVHFFGISLIYITGVFIREFFYGDVFPGATYSQLSWISAGIGISIPVLGPVYGYAITRVGPRVVVIWGGIMIALGFELGSLANETWQIVLTLGVITGIGQSALWVPAMSTIVQWFLLKRGLVVGIVAAGTGLGGLALAPLSQSLIDNLGWRNALRVMGALTGTMISLGGALLFTRFGKENRIDLKFWEKKDPVAEAEKAAKKAAKKKDPFFDPGFFKNPTFIKLYVFAMIQPFAFLFPYTYVPSYAVNIGLSASVGAICLALMNGFSSFGRIFFGWTADKYLGNINSYILCLILPPILALTMWTTCFSQAQLMAFASLYGLFAGGFIVSYPLVLAAVYGAEDLPKRLGVQSTGGLIGQLVGPLICASILDANTTIIIDPVTGAETKLINYVPFIVYLSCVMLINVAIIVWVRIDVAGFKIIKV